jgi:hypothetical protein
MAEIGATCLDLKHQQRALHNSFHGVKLFIFEKELLMDGECINFLKRNIALITSELDKVNIKQKLTTKAERDRYVQHLKNLLYSCNEHLINGKMTCSCSSTG